LRFFGITMPQASTTEAIGILRRRRSCTASPGLDRPQEQRQRAAMKARPGAGHARALYKRRKQTAEPVFGIIKNAMRFVRFHLRGITNVTDGWEPIALACNRPRLRRTRAT
jgi:hypothetical protein